MNMHIEWTQNQARISELKAENAQLLEVIIAHNKKMSEGVYTTNEQCAKEVAEHDRLLAESAAQAKRIAELEETNGLLQTQVHCLEMVAVSKNGE